MNQFSIGVTSAAKSAHRRRRRARRAGRKGHARTRLPGDRCRHRRHVRRHPAHCGPNIRIPRHCWHRHRRARHHRHANRLGARIAQPAGLGRYPARAAIEQRLKTVVILENDAMLRRSARNGWARQGLLDVAMLISAPASAATRAWCRIWQGANGMAGELGTHTVEPNGHPLRMREPRLFGTICFGHSRGAHGAEAIANNGASPLAQPRFRPEFSAKSIYNLAIQGDEDARRIFATSVAAGHCAFVAGEFLELPIYVIGGGGFERMEAFSPAIFEELRLRSCVRRHRAAYPPGNRQGASRTYSLARVTKPSSTGIVGERCRTVRRRPAAMLAEAKR